MRSLLLTLPALLLLACSSPSADIVDCSGDNCDSHDPTYESKHAWSTGECDGTYGWQSDVETLVLWEECLEQVNLDANEELKQFLETNGEDADEVNDADGRIDKLSKANPCHILHALSSETLEANDYAYCEAYWPRELANLIDDFMTLRPRPDWTTSGGFRSCDWDLEKALSEEDSSAYGKYSSCNRSLFVDYTDGYMVTLTELGMEASEKDQLAADLASASSATGALCHSLARATDVTDEEIRARSKVCVAKGLRNIVDMLDVADYPNRQ